MNKRCIEFNDSIIKDFCNITGDTNDLHNPEYMRQKNKLPIVPGMFTLTYALAHAKDYLKKYNTIKVHFGSLLYSGNHLSTYLEEDAILERRICALDQEGNDVLSKKDKQSYVYFTKKDQTPITGVLKKTYLDKETLDNYCNLLNNDDYLIGALLYSIAYSSSVLLGCLESPQSKEDLEAKELFDTTKKIVPVYDQFDIHMPDGLKTVTKDNEVVYITKLKKETKKIVSASVGCYQYDDYIFCANYQIHAIPEKVILRFVPNMT